MALKINRIVRNYIILCEGVDTMNFLLYYLNSKELKDDERFSNDIQLLSFGGINELPLYIANLKSMEGFDSLKSILIVRDAETDVDMAVSMVKKALKNNGLPVPDSSSSWKNQPDNKIRVAFTLMPACSTEPVAGALEDLCWKILVNNADNEVRSDVREFVSQMKNKYQSISSHEHKSRLHTFFSVNENLISLKIGEASKTGAFDWKSPCLDPLKKIIMSGFWLN